MIPKIQPENLEKLTPKEKIEKAIIFDSGCLISFAMSNLLDELKELKKIFKGKFLITEEVKKEIIDKPLTIKRFELQAMMIEKLLHEKIIELPESIGIDKNKITSDTNKYVELANVMFESKRKGVHLISGGEASCLALSRILDKSGVKNLIAIDERTTRLLSEKPKNLRNLMEKRLHSKIRVRQENFKEFKNFKFIRSAELIYVAWKKDLTGLKKGNVLDAMLWALKSHGCAINTEEIEEIVSMK
jgi:hypothetical protein